MFSGATAMSFAVIWLCLKYNIKNTFLTLMGKNTILIMAFNRAALFPEIEDVANYIKERNS